MARAPCIIAALLLAPALVACSSRDTGGSAPSLSTTPSPTSTRTATPAPSPTPSPVVFVLDQDGSSDIDETDSLAVHVEGVDVASSDYQYQWYRNGISLEGQNEAILANQAMKAFAGNPAEYTPPSSHTDHTIRGYAFSAVVFDQGDKVGEASVVIGGPTTAIEMRGVNFATWETWQTESGKGGASLRALQTRVNPNWVSIWTLHFQDAWGDSVIYARDKGDIITIPDAETIHQINTAHDLGLKVILYPQIWLAKPDGSATPWGRDGFVPSEDWFAAYEGFILHQADIANSTGVDLFVVGVELDSTVQESAQWYEIIAKVREHYGGPITYSSIVCCEGGGESLLGVPWLSELDYIGLSANLEYRTDDYDVPLSNLVQYYERRATKFKGVSDYFGKPVIFLETSTFGVDGAALGPWLWREDVPDLQEQADYFDAFLRVFGNKPWVKGIFWNQWLSSQETWYATCPDCDGWSSVEFVGRPAERVLSSWYGAYSG